MSDELQHVSAWSCRCPACEALGLDKAGENALHRRAADAATEASRAVLAAAAVAPGRIEQAVQAIVETLEDSTTTVATELNDEPARCKRCKLSRDLCVCHLERKP